MAYRNARNYSVFIFGLLLAVVGEAVVLVGSEIIE
jgi:hypothetical protein